MPDVTNDGSNDSTPRRHIWPWFVLAALIAAIALAVLWLSFEIKRTERIRDLNSSLRQGSP